MLSIKIESHVIVFLFDWFQACVPTLVDISLDKDTGEAVCLSSLQALTNLSVTSDHHGHYTRLVSRLYELFSEDNTSLQLQALKILINLSCNPDMVPHLLAAKVGRTVNLEIFARILFMRNFVDVKFRENKNLAKWRKHFVLY